MAERSGRSTAAAAADQVRAILEAAEQSAASLEAAAREEAERIRIEAERDASRARAAAGRLAGHADELERRLDELVEGVRSAVAAIRNELDDLRPARVETPAQGDAGEQPEVDEELIAEAEAMAARQPDVAEPEPADVPDVAEPEPESAAAESGAAPEGARVIALKMALDGAPRVETARYLRENFELDDPESLLDEVYARAGR